MDERLLQIQEMIARLERLTPGAVQLDLDLPNAPAPVRADRTQLEQVVVNLVVNAHQAMPAGGTLRIRVSSAPGKVLLERISKTPAAPFGRGAARCGVA